MVSDLCRQEPMWVKLLAWAFVGSRGGAYSCGLLFTWFRYPHQFCLGVERKEGMFAGPLGCCPEAFTPTSMSRHAINNELTWWS